MRQIACAVALTCGLAAAAEASDIKLPPKVTWAAFTSLAEDQARAIGEALRGALGVELVVKDANGDTARDDLLRHGEADFAANSVGATIGAQEGVFDFAAPDWGPQKVRLVLADFDEPIDYALAVTSDLGIHDYADLRGRRVAWYSDQTVVNVNTEAFLAYGGLTWNDVQKVPVKGFFGEGLRAMEEGVVDAAFAATSYSGAYEAAKGPRGLYWPPLDPQNGAGLARMKAVAPYFSFHTVTEGANVDHDHGLYGAFYAFPILIAMDATDRDLVYNMAKALVELYPLYKDHAPGIDGWRLDAQNHEWFVPYHEGAIAYLKEAGVWTAEDQAFNDHLIQRQEALAAAWTALKAENPADWQAAWAERRRQVLKDGGFAPVF
jgi:TRAP transporter TAXI family solute receptor